MKKLIKNNVYWLGKVDWDLRKFHGDELSTGHGSSYNSYLIQEEKNILIDTVWMPYDNEFIKNLSNEIDLKKIDYIIMNHSEVDHSGSLPELMKLIPDTPIYCTANGAKLLKGHYHQDWNFNIVKTGDKLDIGNGKELVFVEMQMLHWPDSMATYLTKDNILFSNDAFGQHYATESLFNDKVDQCDLSKEAIKYYANILTPFSSVLKKKLQEIISFGLTIDIIAPSHGIIWRENPMQIVEKYALWANDYQEDQITVVYDTMWSGTKKIAEKIVEGIQKASPETEVKLFHIAKSDHNDVISEIFKSKMVVLGSPTLNNNILPELVGFMSSLKGLKFKNKKVAAFGCYGWSGESVKQINEFMGSSGFEVVNEGFKNLWNPDEDQLAKAEEFGEQLGKL